MKNLFTFAKLYPIIKMIVLAVFLSTPVIAQINYKTQNYTHQLSPVKVSISFLNFENILTPITAGILMEGQLKDKLFYNMQFRQGYIRDFTIAPDKLLTTQKESKGTVFETGVDYPFSDKIKAGKVKVTSSLSFDGLNTFQEKYFLADCDVRSYWAFSGGLMKNIRPKYINSDSSTYIISGGQDIKASDGNFTHFSQNSNGLYAGIVHRKIKKAVVNSEKWNYRVFYSTKFYAQVLIGSTKIDDIVYNNQTYKIDNAKQEPLGYRIGWQWDQMGAVTGFEFGKMPGITLETPVQKSELDKIFKHNPYLNYVRFTFHFNIFNGDKSYAMKNKQS
ncbi:hypothetical protein [Pedobacter cryophilus]|uniref:Uncharacterized protein n=1 Tax=Pedobacter cryophilus TaxID=2571271 RepID=A0A4U1BTU0_9SPHI|nr:hypothetical protein [Pedobacter cryophilus]TKB95562.1 hypothetical protein FA046_16310 [Pedobacter cryophilus]